MLSEAEFRRYSLDLYILLVQHYRINTFQLYERSQVDLYKEYIEQHFQEELSLAQISSAFYMTPQYFSKHFKEVVGEKFYQYLTKTRLNYAVSLMEQSNMNMLQIALESGFTTTASFNRVFKEVYDCLPTDYRKRIRNQQHSSMMISYQEMLDLLQFEQEKEPATQELITNVDIGHRTPVLPFWKKVINIGSGTSIKSQEAREQFLQFQQELSFEFVRFELYFPKNFNEEYQFYREERELDFFVQLNLKFQLVINFRQFRNTENAFDYLKRFLSHFSNRYSINRVRKWRIELDYPTVFTKSKLLEYGLTYRQISQILEEFKIEESLYGPGFILGDFESFKYFVHQITIGTVPEIHHLTFHIQPEIGTISDANFTWKTVTDQNHVRNQLEMIRSYLQSETIQIHIVEWKAISGERFILHDSTYKAANIIQTSLTSFDALSDIAWNIPLDMILDEDAGRLLSGLEGCITAHGIRKPSYFAHQFLNRHGEELIDVNNHSMLTASGHNITIVSHNCMNLSSRYYLEGNDDLNTLFETREPLKLSFQLRGMKPGNYLVKTRRIHSESGSIIELCQRVFLDGSETAGRSEIEFLKHMTIPHLSVETFLVVDDFDLSVILEPNEIRHTHIIYLY
ncbi:helix-turn-helix domain-containing protein [Streptococcus sp. ZJ93]|uniref:helix-turn-helix domain-containing protein n=1 Tax=Streptococcus handemini TaxID=3161188 RepID=UPI0032EF10FE